LDGVPLHFNMISSGSGVVALHRVERSQWDEARLTVRLRTPRAELEEPTWADVACVAVLTERRTNVRTVTPLRKSSDGSWDGVVILHRDHHLGQSELSGHVVATVDGVAGRMIGTTDRTWTIDLQARTPAKQNGMKILSVNFSDDAYSHLHTYRTDPWAVEVVGDEPTVYLNTGFEGLTDLLHSGERSVRDSLSAQIAVDAWAAMFNAAVYAADVEEGQPLWPGGWRDAVLKRMLPDMFPDRSSDDALTEIVTQRQGGEGDGDLQTRLLHAAGRQALIPRRLGGFIRALNRKEAS
jgi:hypothetical protein